MRTIFAAILLVALVVGFNIQACLIVLGRNPIMAVSYDFAARKWKVARHTDNLASKVFGYLWAGGIFVFDALVVRSVISRMW